MLRRVAIAALPVSNSYPSHPWCVRTDIHAIAFKSHYRLEVNDLTIRHDGKVFAYKGDRKWQAMKPTGEGFSTC